MKRSITLKLLLAFSLLIVLAGAVSVATYREIGRTPEELLDYVDRRLQGHPSLEKLALPWIGSIRNYFGALPVQHRLNQPFAIPPLPPLPQASSLPPIGGTETGKVWRVGPTETLRTIAEAARLAQDGDTVEIVAGEYRGDVALWSQKKLSIKAVGGKARLHAAGRSAEGKAIWVIRHGTFDIENIEFVGARVPDRNGAAIRFEGGHLRISHCLFFANENGLLVTDNPASTLEIYNSEFAYNGAGDGQSHNLYVGKIASLTIKGSYFHHANIGHLIKSRAESSEIAYNRITDESGGKASYEIDLPNGGEAYIVGNLIQQSPTTENSTLISFGAEGYKNSKARLFLVHNTLVNDARYGGAFLRVAPGAETIVSAGNFLVGGGKYHLKDPVKSANDFEADWDIFRQPARYDYRLNTQGQKLLISQPSTDFPEARLKLSAQYLHPGKTVPLATPPRFPGALQQHD